MYSLKERSGVSSGISALEEAPTKPILAAKRRRQPHPFFFHMGPVALCITSVLLIGLMAVLYLSQVGQAVAANQRMQDMRAAQVRLQRQSQDLQDTIAREQSPDYIASRAKAQGLVPANEKFVQVLIVPHLQPVPTRSDSVHTAQP